MIRRLGVAALAAATCLLAVPAARATAVTGSELRALAARAASGDAPALAALRAVDVVDDRPVSLAQALGGAAPSELRARLRVLAGEGSAPPPSSAGARHAAASILSERRFGGPVVKQPLSPLQSLINQVSGSGSVLLWGGLGALVLVAAAVATRRTLGRLGPPIAVHPEPGARAIEEDPGSLERAARDAESAGAFGEAVRLRFRAGLMALGLRAVIEYRPSTRTAEIARRLRSPEFDLLTRTFERVAYGGAVAEESDAAAAREGWKRLLATVPEPDR